MSAASSPGLSEGRQALLREGYVFVPGSQMQDYLHELAGPDALADWDTFAASWSDLEVDRWMADRAAYRRRRHAVFHLAADGTLSAQAHQAHYQGLHYNPLHGGVQRWFEPIAPAQLHSSSLRSVLLACHRLFAPLRPAALGWKVEVHQFRIEAKAGEAGLPTPEGVHRDGVDWVLVLMIQRHNIVAGTTTIHDLARAQVGSFTLCAPFDAALVDDQRCFHGVTAVLPADPAQTGWRDVLVVTLQQRA
jgi:hypothetical protein